MAGSVLGTSGGSKNPFDNSLHISMLLEVTCSLLRTSAWPVLPPSLLLGRKSVSLRRPLGGGTGDGSHDV